MTLDDLRNLQPEIPFHSKLIREIIAAVEHWKDFKTASILTREKEKPVINNFVSTLDKPPEIYSGHGKIMIFITRDLIQPAVIYLATIYQFDPNFDCELEYRNYQSQRRDVLLRWIKNFYKHYRHFSFMRNILIAGLVLKNLSTLDFTRKWKMHDSDVLLFLQSIGIPAVDNFSDADFQAAEFFIVHTIKKFCPNEIYKCDNVVVLSFFDTTLDTPFGCIARNYKVTKVIDIPDAEILREESQATIIDFEDYKKHKEIIDTFKDDDSTLIFSKAKVIPISALIGKIEHTPKSKPSMRDKLAALVELNKFRRLEND